MKVKEWFEKVFFYGVGIVFLVGFFTITQFLIYKTIPTENKELISGILETLKNGAILILGYFYGSSRSSAEKSTTIDKKLNQENQ